VNAGKAGDDGLRVRAALPPVGGLIGHGMAPCAGILTIAKGTLALRPS